MSGTTVKQLIDFLSTKPPNTIVYLPGDVDNYPIHLSSNIPIVKSYIDPTTNVLVGQVDRDDEYVTREFPTAVIRDTITFYPGKQEFTSDRQTDIKVYTPGIWDFPSDHLPVCASIILDYGRTINVASFNVLNEAYKSYLLYGNGKQGNVDYERGQQLSGSFLATVSSSVRESQILYIIKKGFQNDLHLIGLQECSKEMVATLRNAFSETHGFEIAGQNDEMDTNKDFGVVIYDKKILKVIKVNIYRYKKNEKPSNYIQVIDFKNLEISGSDFTFVNTHVPFEQSHQLIEIVKELNDDKQPTILVGDLNLGFFDSRRESSLQLNFIDKIDDTSFKRVISIADYSHVNTEPVLDLFDHIFVSRLSAIPNRVLTQAMRS